MINDGIHETSSKLFASIPFIKPSIEANNNPPIADIVSVQPLNGSLIELITIEGLTIKTFRSP
jgi:hypothetical protein